MQASPEVNQWSLIEDFIQKSDRFLLKKLSRNDTSWADSKNSHQSGFYVPADLRLSGFFPEFVQKRDKPHIFEAACPTVWPEIGELCKESGLRHYSNKGSETHFTRVPKALFAGLSPASWLLGGVLRDPIGSAWHWFMTIDSESQEASLLETRLDIESDFHFRLFDPEQFLFASRVESDRLMELIVAIRTAISQGTVSQLMQTSGKLPSPAIISWEAMTSYLDDNRMDKLDPWQIKNPGDALMRISRDIEFKIYKQYELKHRAIQVAQILSGYSDLSTAAVLGFPALDSIFLSASQQRKSRAGKSFEQHLASLLSWGGIRYQEQEVVDSRRPDFVLPDKATVMQGGKTQGRREAVILSAKTTLRERWKQISHERFGCPIFLATVDDRVSAEVLIEMERQEIVLVVPESLKEGTESLYAKHSNVISFRAFFDDEIARKRPSLLVASPIDRTIKLL